MGKTWGASIMLTGQARVKLEHRIPSGAGQGTMLGDGRLVGLLGSRKLRAERRLVCLDIKAGEWSRANRVGHR